MINTYTVKKLDNRKADIAKKLHALFLKSYSVEATLLRAVDFPPLRRPVEDFMHSGTEFYGILKDREVIAAIEITTEAHALNIDSLVVDPDQFRQRLGETLVAFILKKYAADRYTVETGAANLPAIRLYEKLGFGEIKRWNTDSGIAKVKMEKSGMTEGH